ncbi:MAG: tetratricopeptide repeat protein [Planctomycetota bacterium]|jgi:tetratricopeptide (TPR) repeat protein
MKTSEKEKQFDRIICNSAPFDKPVAHFAKWRHDYAKAVQILKSQAERGTFAGEKTMPTVRVCRIIMKSRTTRIAAVAVFIAVAASIILLDRSVKPAWAVEQTIEAFDEIRTLIVSGTNFYDSEPIPFRCWIKLDDANSLYLRFEDEKQIVVVQGGTAYEYWRPENLVKIKLGPAIHDLKFWYKAAELSPWLTGTMLETLRLMADDWQHTYGTYGKDGEQKRDCVFVTCSYKPLSRSFWMVFDLESKLIVQGKFWGNIHGEGLPHAYADSFVYNQEIPDETFEFEIPQDASVVNKKELDQARALFDRAEGLFNDKRQPAEAIKIYRQVYERYAHLGAIGEEALGMMGICYANMGQYENAIQMYKKALREYPNLKGWSESTYFYLGHAYLQIDQKDKALEAFKNSLIVGEGVRDPDKFPLRHACEYIEKIENEK